MEEICLNVGATWATIAGTVVTISSVLANILPNVGETTSKPVKVIVKLVNWLGVNFKVNTEDKKEA